MNPLLKKIPFLNNEKSFTNIVGSGENAVVQHFLISYHPLRFEYMNGILLFTKQKFGR